MILLSAILGIFGVFVGAVLTQRFAIASEWRTKRLDAMIGIAAATGRIIGAHERLFEILFKSNETPAPADQGVVSALAERSAAHNDWRKARAQVEILIPYDSGLRAAMDSFNHFREASTVWVHAYLEEGTDFRSSDFDSQENTSWAGMRGERQEIMRCSRFRAAKDARWFARAAEVVAGRNQQLDTTPHN